MQILENQTLRVVTQCPWQAPVASFDAAELALDRLNGGSNFGVHTGLRLFGSSLVAGANKHYGFLTMQ